MDMEHPVPEVAIEILRGTDTTQAHVLGLFNRDDVLRHLQVEPTRALEDGTYDNGDYWANLSGRQPRAVCRAPLPRLLGRP